MQMKFLAIAALTLAASVAPCLSAETNMKNLDFDLSKVTRENFYDIVVPAAKAEGTVTMYNFAGSFADTWKNLTDSFTAKYGIKVVYSDVNGDQANQQLIAVQASGQDAPVDAYFAGGGSYPLLSAKGVIGKIPLTQILPNMATYDPVLAQTLFGRQHGGTFPLVHLNQTAIGYDSAFVKPNEVPKSFDELLAWAESHPKRLGVTLPAKGGSGGGFIYSVALNYLTGDCRTALTDYSKTLQQAEDWAMTSECLTPVWDYYRRLLKAAELTNGNADTLNLINNQQLYMGTVWEDQVMSFLGNKQLPETFRLTLLEKGQVGSGDAMFVPANAKHVAAALLLIDMAMSKEFQTFKLETKASRSPRTDITNDLIPAALQDHVLPKSVYPRLSVSAFWDMSTALAEALDEKVLNQ
ncbi:extracellular solute-binding protein [Agrobacterium vitis]|uniref:extracellular solute-binding protein n=1 Tax=Rhizobium/Agrobacterium group TaxID=227290 RepID=UPI0008FBA305|nr:MULTISPECIES: extracellular solute-binding protein [Rhizobium/Agrobacterium group]MCF1435255.1 extracellular solute-binding protein [Allorhizobium ampelinum]MUO89905.1 extracellular solute-binding protein [Agrobacterium vitis]MUZ53158.1 extracellular solute-binding protein [Agrobacterium vitis]MUZ91377.1 extracellular solute-binding protein [Agrobacterium vitis]MVA40179.1 extracellular solute-binding protein [Agrobacterium vitis]